MHPAGLDTKTRNMLKVLVCSNSENLKFLSPMAQVSDNLNCFNSEKVFCTGHCILFGNTTKSREKYM